MHLCKSNDGYGNNEYYFKIWNSTIGKTNDRCLHKGRSHLNLIISGSVFTLMKKIFEDYEEPLFGRANEKMTLQPFTTDVLKQILADLNPNYTPEDLLALYSISLS